MGVTEIIVLVAAALVIGGLGALAYYANMPAKEGSEKESKKSK